MGEKTFRTVVWEAFLLGRRLLTVSSVVVGAGWTGSRLVRSYNEAPAEKPANEKTLEALLNEGGAVPDEHSTSQSSSAAAASARARASRLGLKAPPVAARLANPFDNRGSMNIPPSQPPPGPPPDANGGNNAAVAQQAPGQPTPQPAVNGVASGSANATGLPSGGSSLTTANDGRSPAGAATPGPTDGSGSASSASTGGYAAGTSVSPTATPTSSVSTTTGTSTTTTSSALTIVSTALPASAQSGVKFTTSPAFTLEYKASQSIATSYSAQATLAAYTDSACSQAATGTLGGTLTGVGFVSGVAKFTNANYTPVSHVEESIYLRAYTASITGCGSTAIPVLQRFNAGVGYVTLASTANGFANASSAARVNNAVAVDRDSSGRYYVGGSSLNAAGGTELFIARYYADGVLDTTFGSSGVFLYQNGSTGPTGYAAGSRLDRISGIKIDSSGLVIAIGTTKDAGGGTDIFALRLASSGTLDTSFGTTGLVVLQSSGLGLAGATNAQKDDEVSKINALVIDSMGRYVFPISSKNASGGSEAGIAVLTTAGALDSTFGTSGIAWVLHGASGPTGVAVGSRAEIPEALQIDGTGDLVAAFAVGGGGTQTSTLVARFGYSGTPDSSFNTSGLVTLTSGTGANVPTQIRVLSSGPIVGVERVGNVLAIFRLTSAGAADTSFGSTGLVTYSSTGPSAGGAAAANDAPVDLSVISSTGSYWITGWTTNSSGATQLAQWRYLSTGTLDTSFGTGGVSVFTNSGADLAGVLGGGDVASGHAYFDSYGRALEPVQTLRSNGNTDFGAIRFLSTGAADL